MKEYNFKIGEDDKNKRLDLFLSEQLPEFSRSYIQKFIEDNQVTVNSKNKKSNYKVVLNDLINFFIEEKTEFIPLKEKIDLDILYEDDDLLVINKPQNMVVHPAAGNYSHTLVNALLEHCGENLSDINGDLRPGIVHRIDKDTSGILVVAKNNDAHNSLALQLKNHTMIRKYYAITIGNLKEDSGDIEAPIGRDVKDRKKMAINLKTGKNASTHFEVLERFNNFTLIEATLKTGRTHQIRVHMSSLGHPLLGDKVYGPKKQNINAKLIGQVLHAKTLCFIHPSTGKQLKFDSELPEYFTNLMDKLRNF